MWRNPYEIRSAIAAAFELPDGARLPHTFPSFASGAQTTLDLIVTENRQWFAAIVIAEVLHLALQGTMDDSIKKTEARLKRFVQVVKYAAQTF